MVTRVLNQILLSRWAPERIRLGHGPKFISATFGARCESQHTYRACAA